MRRRSYPDVCPQLSLEDLTVLAGVFGFNSVCAFANFAADEQADDDARQLGLTD